MKGSSHSRATLRSRGTSPPMPTAKADATAAVEAILRWAESGALHSAGDGVPFGLAAALIEPSPGEARVKTRSRLSSALSPALADPGPENTYRNAPPDAAYLYNHKHSGANHGAIDAAAAQQATARLIACVWLGEAAALGFVTRGEIAERAATFAATSLRLAAGDGSQHGASDRAVDFAALLPHVGRVILALADAPPVADGTDADAAPASRLAIDLALQARCHLPAT